MGVDLLEDCTHNLRLASERIRVLNAVIVCEVAGADFRALEEVAIDPANFDLLFVATNLVDPVVKRGVGAFGGIDRKCSGHDCCAEDLLGFEESLESDRGTDLGAVQEC